MKDSIIFPFFHLRGQNGAILVNSLGAVQLGTELKQYTEIFAQLSH